MVVLANNLEFHLETFTDAKESFKVGQMIWLSQNYYISFKNWRIDSSISDKVLRISFRLMAI
jgi:hypothetical protein